MNPRFLGLAIVLGLAACSSSTNPSGNPKDADAAKDSGIAEDSVSHPDGDGGTQCSIGQGQMADFGVTLPDLDYDGLVRVRAGDASSELVVESDGGYLGVFLHGVLATIPTGTTLWAELHQQTRRPNPYALPQRTNAWTLRSSEQGVVLAGGLFALVPEAPASATLLGVSVTATPLCSQAQITNIVTGASCLTTSYFSVTVHGDRELTLQPGTTGYVSIRGEDYQVWVGNAYRDIITTTGCIADWVPPVGLSITARAVRFADIAAAGP